MATVYLAHDLRHERRVAIKVLQPHANYDVSPDGKSFVMLRRSPSSHIVVLQNVRALLRRSRRGGG